MKSIVVLAEFAMVLGLSILAVNGQSDKRVADIRAKVAEINGGAAKYHKENKNVVGISTEGAEVTLFRTGEELKKISAKIYGETFKGTSEFYFSGGELIFQYDRVSRYDTQIGLAKPVKVVRIEQYRSYFDKGKMFRLQIGNRVIEPGTDDFIGHESDSLKNVKAILDPANTE